MRATIALCACLAVSIVIAPSRAHAQTSPKLDPQTQLLLDKWNLIGQGVVEVADVFPAEKYGYRPVARVRTFAEQLRHLAFWNFYSVARARGDKLDAAQNELSALEYPDKPAIIAGLKKINADGAALIARSSPSVEQLSNWSGAIEHAMEHYGQLVVYLRLNGIVPPATAKQQQ